MLLVCVFAAAAFAAAFIYICLTGAVWQALAVFAAVFVGLHLLLICFFAVVGAIAASKKPLEKQNVLCRFGAWCFGTLGCFYSGSRVHLVGREKLPESGRFVLVSNHRSGKDPIAVLSAMYKYNISFISKPSNMKLPVLGSVAYGAGFLPIDRENDRSALRTILQAVDYLKRDICSVAIYPEGTRNRGEGLLPFHAGSFKLPQRAGVPLVIMATTGTSRKDGRGLLGRDVYLNVLETVDADRVKAMPSAELSEYARTRIENFLNERKQ